MRPPYSISAVILARGGSKGIPKKNLQEISGMSLVGRTISAAKSSKFLKGIYLSTDDSLIADEGKRSGATIIHRPAKISNDKASSEVGWLHALEEIQAINKQIDFLVFLQCTSPFTTGEDIDGCINALLNSNASCSISVIPDHSFVWAVNEHGFGEGVNHDVSRQRLRRQDMAPYFRENGAIYCVRVGDFQETKNRFCGPVKLYEVAHPAIEIDTPEDLEVCKAIFRTRKTHK